MRVSFLDQVSANPESSRQKTNLTVKGADVFGWNLLSALLEYGTYDAYLVQGLTEEKKELLIEGGLTLDNIKRLVSVPWGGALPLKDSDQLVFLTSGRYLNALAAAREKWKRYDAPVCGFIHSINSPRIALALLQQCFVGLSEADLLLCSSRAGMQTIDVYVEEINRLLPQELSYRARRVLVPLGVKEATPLKEAGEILRKKFHIESDTSIALYFGRLSQASKCDLGPLLVAVSQLLKRGKKCSLIVAGDDTQIKESPRLQALASELGCQENVEIWTNPSADEKSLLYSGADFFVSPSDNLQETFGIALAEAMAYGLPVVVSDWDGYRELVQDGKTGFLVPSILPSQVRKTRLSDCATSMFEEDSLAQSTTIDVSALSDRMERLAIHSELRKRMGQAAKRFIESYCTWRIVVRQYEELWEYASGMAGNKNLCSPKSKHLLNLSLEKCFGHYANAIRTLDAKCFVSAEGQEWLRRPGRFYFLDRISTNPCPQQFAGVLRAICDHPGISAADIVATFSKDSVPMVLEDVEWILARLFKYGLVVANEARLS